MNKKNIAKKIMVFACIFSLIFSTTVPSPAYALSASSIGKAVANRLAKVLKDLYEDIVGDAPTSVNVTNNPNIVGSSTPPNSASITGASGSNSNIIQSLTTGSSSMVSFTSDGGFETGAHVTAQATPSGFSTATNGLYFTWYLKHENCDLTEDWWENDASGGPDECDLDDDGKITPNDWKIAATLNVIRGNSSYSSTATTANPEVEGADSWRYTYTHDRDEGNPEDDDVDGEVRNCYVQDSETGDFFELRSTEDIDVDEDNACPPGYHFACLEDDTMECDSDATMIDAFIASQQTGITTIGDPESAITSPPFTGWMNDIQGSGSNASIFSACESYCATSCDTPCRNYVTNYCQSLYNQCVAACGDPADPGYAACVALCTPVVTCVNSHSANIRDCIGITNPADPYDYGSENCMYGDDGYGIHEGNATYDIDGAGGYSSVTVGSCVYDCAVNCTNSVYGTGVTNANACYPEDFDPDDYTGMEMNICQATSGSDGICRTSNVTMNDLRNGVVRMECENGDLAACVKDNSLGLSIDGGEFITTDDATGEGVQIFSAHILGENNFNNTTGGASGFDVTTTEEMCTMLTFPLETGSNIFFGSSCSAYSECSDLLDPDCAEACPSYLSTCAGILYTIALSNNGGDVLPVCSFEKGTNLCKHLFPYYPDELGSMSGSRVGDGDFDSDEVEFWGTDEDGVVQGKNWEGLVMGQGVDRFTWTMVEGDMVGVAIEGVSNQPSENDGSNRIMWAFTNGTCEALEGLEEEGDDLFSEDGDNPSRAFYIDENTGNRIMTTDLDLDRCFTDDENLLEPGDNGLSERQIQMTASPARPVNDPSGNNNGDIVNITASVINAGNTGNIEYEWDVQRIEPGSGSISPNEQTEWDSITGDMRTAGSFFTPNIDGIGKNKLSFKLNLDEGIIPGSIVSNDGIFYLRVRVATREYSGSGSSSARIVGYILLTVKQLENYILATSAMADASGYLSIGSDTGRCGGFSTSEGFCGVTKNEIIGLRIEGVGISSVEWKINNNSFSCPSNADCGSNGNTLYFPVVGEVGDAIQVTARIIKGNEIHNVSKLFIIKEPGISILLNNFDPASGGICDVATQTCPKLLGHWKDLDGNKTPDYSSEVFETLMGNDVNLQAEFLPGRIQQTASYYWLVDGQTVIGNSPDYYFNVQKEPGDSYTVGVVSEFDPVNGGAIMNNYRKALWDHWKIEVNDVADEDQIASVQINVVGGPIAKADQQGTMASLISNLPKHALFVLEIVLTGLVLMLTMGLLFAFIPENAFERKRKNL